jgi:hypothetical protein
MFFDQRDSVFSETAWYIDNDRLYKNQIVLHLRAPGNGVSSGSSRVTSVSTGAIIICKTCHQEKRQ